MNKGSKKSVHNKISSVHASGDGLVRGRCLVDILQRLLHCALHELCIQSFDTHQWDGFRLKPATLGCPEPNELNARSGQCQRLRIVAQLLSARTRLLP